MSTWDEEVKCYQDMSQGRDTNLDHVRAELLDPDLHHHLGLGLVPVVGDLTTDECDIYWSPSTLTLGTGMALFSTSGAASAPGCAAAAAAGG